MNTSKAYIDVNHIKLGRWEFSLVDVDWYAFCRRCTKASKEKIGKKLMTLAR